MYCKKCGMVGLSKEYKFCPFHGIALIPDKKECIHCSEDIWANAKFCHSCGRPAHAEK